jgi:hypothetical protein
VGGGGFTGSSGGGNGYSWSGGSSSGSSGGFYSSSGQTPITFSSSTPISQPSTSTFTIPQPERLFNIIEIDDSLIPQGEDFLIRTTVGSTINKSLTDSVEIYKIESSEEISDITSDNLIGSEDITIPKNNTITNEQNLSINTIGEYTIYVSLKESDKYKVAGTLDVFDANRENASIEDGSITPKNAGTDENVTVEINRTNINFEGADGVKVDIFENGIRVAEGEVMNKADSNLVGNEKNKLTYIKSYPQPQYVQYHAGIQESQDVKLLDTRIISNEIQNDDISEFIANAEIINRDTICKTDTYTSDQFDCEVTIGNHNPLDFSAENSSFTDSNGNPLDMNYTWIMGSERTISINDKSEIVSQTFEETYLEYGLRDDFSGTKLNNRLNQKEGKYNTGSIIWDNAWLRPDWTPETTETYSMNDGYISVTNNDASIRAPTVNVDVTDGFRMKIDMRHNRTRGRMNFELGRIEDGTWTTIFKITNNAGNNKLAGLVYINGNTNTIYSSTRTTNDDTWYTYEISYDGNTWRFKRNGSTLGTASFSTPNKEPTHMQLRNSAHDGEGGLWRNLYIDSEY